MRPDLEVVGHHEMLRDALPENAVDEILEVGEAGHVEWLLLRFDHSKEALQNDLTRQILDVVLKRVGEKPVEHPDPRFALKSLVLIPEQLVEEPVEVLVMREQNVPADIVRKSVARCLGRRESAHAISRLQHKEVVIA